jgi:hypothetical protein
VFCDEALSPVAAGSDLRWSDRAGSTTCTDGGGTGPHYPGREADLFWRGSAILDLTADDAVIDLTQRTRVSS